MHEKAEVAGSSLRGCPRDPLPPRSAGLAPAPLARFLEVRVVLERVPEGPDGLELGVELALHLAGAGRCCREDAPMRSHCAPRRVGIPTK